eukprot:jgi/Tetstr1/465609/TSEL_010255.t1
MPEGVSARAPRIPLPPVFSGHTKGWRRWRHQMEAYCNATGMKQAMMMSEHASSDQHFKLYATLTALLPEELLDAIRRHLNDNATSGGQAWAALRTRFEGGHLGRISDMYAITEAHRRVVDETDDVEEELEIEEEPLTAEELELGPQRPTLELTQLKTNEGTDDGGQEEPIVQRAERDPYPARSRRAPGQWWVVHQENPKDDAAATMAAAFAAVTQDVDEPITLKQALSGPFKEQWAQAVESEFNSLEKQGTWVVCELPEERTAIPSKWVFKVKYNADGSIARFKARLVVQGCRQRHGIDYAETFAPTVKFTTIRVLFAIAVQYGWNIHQVDVDTAFLYAPVEEEIYMRPPPGYE